MVKTYKFGVDGVAQEIKEPQDTTNKTQEVKNFGEDESSARDWGKQHLNKRNWTADEMDLVREYVRFGCAKIPGSNEYVGINPDIRRGEEDVKQFTECFDKLFQPTSESIIVYRRSSGNELNLPEVQNIVQGTKVDKNKFAVLKNKMTNKSVEDLAYLSTALCKDPGKTHFSRNPVLIELLVPKGTPAIYTNSRDRELLLPRGSSYKIDDISIFNDTINNRESIKIKATLVTK